MPTHHAHTNPPCTHASMSAENPVHFVNARGYTVANGNIDEPVHGTKADCRHRTMASEWVVAVSPRKDDGLARGVNVTRSEWGTSMGDAG